ncbi:hypothetical protein [uncultured Alistipes sp.]|uniref:hypothetical protein n=1 Tax=uncultured Alistipes sp. TaxID=538949 RepID=UPI0026498428|nr:hypothetical protein [uncultured Alistipes sp.]
MVDEDDVAAEHRHQGEGVAQQAVEFGVDALLLEVGRTEKAGVEDAEQEDGGDADDDLPRGRRPLHAAAGLRIARAGESVGQPAYQLGDYGCRDGRGRDSAPEQLLEEAGAVDAEQVGDEDADECQRGHQFDPQSAPHRDDKDHREGQHRKRYIVDVIENSAQHRHGDMRRRKKVDDRRNGYRRSLHGPGLYESESKISVFRRKFQIRR